MWKNWAVIKIYFKHPKRDFYDFNLIVIYYVHIALGKYKIFLVIYICIYVSYKRVSIRARMSTRRVTVDLWFTHTHEQTVLSFTLRSVKYDGQTVNQILYIGKYVSHSRVEYLPHDWCPLPSILFHRQPRVVPVWGF